MDNINTATTYSLPSTEFYLKYYIENRSILYRVKNNRMIEIWTASYYYDISVYNVTVKNEEKYTRIIRKDSDSEGDGDIYFCLENECKYVCGLYSSYDYDWDLLKNPCYKIHSDFDLDFNDVYYEIYNNAKNYNPTTKKNNKEIDFKKEGKNIRKEKEVKISKRYYYEDVKEGGYGYYKGYFIIDNTLTIIEQTSSSSQKNVEQLRLVLELDSGTSMSYIYIIYIYSLNRINEIRRYRR